jgi:HlyD family secretion protein
MNAPTESPAIERLASTTLPPEANPTRDSLARPPWWQRVAPWIVATAVVALAAESYLWWARQRDGPARSYVTETVSRGNLRIFVIANGALQPTRTVNVGSELSGTVTRVLVDVNDRVKKGQVLVELDTAKFRDQVARSRATLASSVAKVAQAVATVKESQANLARLQDVARLSGGKVPSKAELDAAQATFERAQADEAAARASVADAKAALSTDETNLAKASIRAPSDGVVLTRSVDPGNAVAASLQAVTLFTIAEDLSKMKLQINVDEADVGTVSVGQTATFTVSAYPSRKYPAKVTRVAYGSTISDNVVTYVAYLEVENGDLALRPGMSATASINATERRDVLLVPNAALRFNPSLSNAAAPAAGAVRGGGMLSGLMPRPPGPNATPKTVTVTAGGATARQIWVLRGNEATPIPIMPGASDGKITEVDAPDLRPGMKVIVDQRFAANS